MDQPETMLRSLFDAALRAVDPGEAVLRQEERIRSRYRESQCRRLLVLGFGKAAVPMACAVETSCPDLAPRGVVITTEGYPPAAGLGGIRVREASHPVPDQRGVAATEEVMALAHGADAETLALVLISGGGSALLVSPDRGLTLEDKQETTSLLLAAGADIGAVNTVRKHLSRVKGGRLAQALFPAPFLALILSDVLGDPPDVIASGPTVPDRTTFAQALAVVERYGLFGRLPRRVEEHLQRGVAGIIPDTPQGGEAFVAGENVIVANLEMALAAARWEAERRGYRTILLPEPVTGEASMAGAMLAQRALALREEQGRGEPLCLISGGETTVTVRGTGRGGRNQELALAFAREIDGREGVTLLSAGTDGRDGPTGAAGAWVDGTTARRGRELGYDPDEALAANDSWTFFNRVGGLLVTGPTGTNVTDLQLVLMT